MRIIRVSEKLSVADQPDISAFPQLAAQGFTALINNRPDGEDAEQPGTAREAASAEAAGLAYSHIPVTMPSIGEADVRRFQSAMQATDGPVLAHCKGGTRSLMLWVIGEVLDGRMQAADVPAFGARLGVNLQGTSAWLARRATTPS